MNQIDLPFTLRDIPTIDEVRHQNERLGIDLPAIPLIALLRLMRVGNDIQASMEAQLKQSGLSMARFVLLAQLMRSDDHELTPSKLAEGAGVTRATVTGLLDGMEKRGWVERSHHPSDRRSVLVQLTDSGMSFFREILPSHLDHIGALIRNIDETDLTHLMATLDQIVSNVSKTHYA